MDINIFVAIILGMSTLYWFYRCIVKIQEGWIINIKRFGRYNRTISGVPDWTPDKEGKMIYAKGKNRKKFAFIFAGIDKIDGYQFNWGEAKSTAKGTDKDSETIIWGTPGKDPEISIQRNEWTTHHKFQHDYRFRINGLETGEKRKQIPKIAPAPKEKAAVEEKPAEDVMVENIKTDSLLNATTRIYDGYKIQYKTGADVDWYTSLQAVLKGVLGEVICDNVYDKLGELRGDKLSLVPVTNTEPQENTPGYDPIYKDAAGKRRDIITFLERINYEMVVVKDLGVEVITISLVDYDLSEEDKTFAEAIRKNSISRVGVETANNEAMQIKVKQEAFIEPRKKAALELVGKYQEATVAVIAEQNKSTTAIADALKQTNVKFIGSISFPGSQQTNQTSMPSIDTVTNIIAAKQIGEEFQDVLIEDRPFDSKKTKKKHDEKN